MPFQIRYLKIPELQNWRSEKLTLMFSLKKKLLGLDLVGTSAKLLDVLISSLVKDRCVFMTLSRI